MYRRNPYLDENYSLFINSEITCNSMVNQKIELFNPESSLNPQKSTELEYTMPNDFDKLLSFEKSNNFPYVHKKNQNNSVFSRQNTLYIKIHEYYFLDKTIEIMKQGSKNLVPDKVNHNCLNCQKNKDLQNCFSCKKIFCSFCLEKCMDCKQNFCSICSVKK